MDTKQQQEKRKNDRHLYRLYFYVLNVRSEVKRLQLLALACTGKEKMRCNAAYYVLWA